MPDYMAGLVGYTLTRLFFEASHQGNKEQKDDLALIAPPGLSDFLHRMRSFLKLSELKVQAFELPTDLHSDTLSDLQKKAGLKFSKELNRVVFDDGLLTVVPLIAESSDGG